METFVKNSILTNEELEDLPLFFNTIYYNNITNIKDEEKLYKYNSRIQRNYMREYEPNRLICKLFNVDKLSYEKF